MPTYDYECEKCGHVFEVFQRITEAPRKRCPTCSGKVRRRISGGAGLLFKGSGFYITDYRSEGYKKSAQGDSSTAAKPAAEAKPAAPAKPAGGDAKKKAAPAAP